MKNDENPSISANKYGIFILIRGSFYEIFNCDDCK